MTVKKRGAGYQANFTVKDKRYIRAFPTQEEAEDFERETRRALKKGTTVPEMVKQVGGSDAGTIGNIRRSACTNHWERQKGGGKGVINSKVFVEWVGANTPPKDALSKAKVEEFIEHLKTERRVGDTTINRYLAMLSILCKTAKMTLSQDIKYSTEGIHRDRYFEYDEIPIITRFLEMNGYIRERDLFIFLVDTGLRPWAEAATLDWREVKGGRVTVLKQYSKNGKARTIPLTDRANQAVERQRKLGLEGPWQGLRSATEMSKIWKLLRARHPQFNDAVWYTCRHTSASWQVIAGVDLYRVMTWMGHKNISQTQRYAHLAANHMEENLTALNSVIQTTIHSVSQH